MVENPYFSLESEAPFVFGYFSAILLSDEKPEVEPVKVSSYPGNLGLVKHQTLDTGAVFGVSSNGFFFVDLTNDANFTRAIFPSDKGRQTVNGRKAHEKQKVQHTQNGQLARLFLRSHQAFFEGAIHSTGSGGAIMNLIGSVADLGAVYSTNGLLNHPHVKKQWEDTPNCHPMPWKVAAVAFSNMLRAQKYGGNQLLRLTELYQVSCKRFSANEYEEVVSLSWLICESIVSRAWEYHFRGIFKNTGREAELSKTRISRLDRMSSGLRLELLDGYGVLSTAILDDLKKLKKTRNAVVHDVDSVSIQQAKQALVCCKNLFREIYDVRVTIMQSSHESYSRRWLR